MAKNLSPKRYNEEEIKDTIPFTGVARSVECFNNNGQFRDFRIVTMRIVEGRVVDLQYSDPYSNFEVDGRMELSNHMSIIHLNNTWEAGKAFSK